MSKVKWKKGVRGHANRESVCGRYVIELTSLGDRHENSRFWGCRLAELEDGRWDQWLRTDGSVQPRHSHPPEGLMSEAKESAQAHADCQIK